MRNLAPLWLALLAACRASGLAPDSNGGLASDPSPEDTTTAAFGSRCPADDPTSVGALLCDSCERVRITSELSDALAARYVFFDQKSRMLARPGLLAFDPREHLRNCVAAERAIPRETDPLRFLDRLRACIATFEDGHLFLAMPRALPQVSLGVRLRRAEDGRVYVAYRDPGVVRWLDSTPRPGGRARLAVGTRLWRSTGGRWARPSPS